VYLPNRTIELISLALAAILVALLAVIGYRLWKASRIHPAERERRRRVALAAGGKLADAALLDYRDGQLIYSYSVRGVEYTASQDVTTLSPLIPNDFTTLGPVFVKYDSRNPANSIVLAETWKGLRAK
jgi:hypothetical protein